MAAQQRPLSPHLQIYAKQMTSVLSIAHRASGVWLGFVAFALVAWLLAVAGGSGFFTQFNAVAGSLPGQGLMVLTVASLVYHSLNGIRHLLWDIGWGFELPHVNATGWVVIALTVLITAAIVWLAWSAGGAA